jgi:hypothetical protein
MQQNVYYVLQDLIHNAYIRMLNIKIPAPHFFTMNLDLIVSVRLSKITSGIKTVRQGRLEQY